MSRIEINVKILKSLYNGHLIITEMFFRSQRNSLHRGSIVAALGHTALFNKQFKMSTLLNLPSLQLTFWTCCLAKCREDTIFPQITRTSFNNPKLNKSFKPQSLNTFPLDETHLVVVRGFIHQEVSPKCVNEESSTDRRSYNRQVNRYPQL